MLQINQQAKIHWKNSNSILILGAGTTNNKINNEIIPTLFGFSRLLLAAKLYHQCKLQSAVCTLFISGGDKVHTGETEAAVYQRALLSLGVAAKDVQLETRSLNTFENARYLSVLLKKCSNDQILLINSNLTLKRALLYFSYFGIHPISISSDFIGPVLTLRPNAYNLVMGDFALHELIGILRFYVYNFFRLNEA